MAHEASEVPSGPAPDLPDPLPAAISAAHARYAQAVERLNQGDLKQARAICEDVLNEYADYVGARHTLARVHIADGRHPAALPLLVRAAMENPRDRAILRDLGRVYFRLGSPECAIDMMRRAIALGDDSADAQFELGRIHESENEHEASIRCFETALARDPSYYRAAYELGRAYHRAGRSKDAVEASMKAHRMRPLAIGPIISLTQISGASVSIDLRSALEAAYGDRDIKDEEFETRVSFARAAILDRLGRHREAWEELVEANSNPARHYAKAYVKQARRRQSQFSRAERCRAGLRVDADRYPDAPISLFILGPSRSGKSSLEKLAGCLAGAKRGYEAAIVEASFRRTTQSAGLLSWGRLLEMREELDEAFASVYHDELLRRAAGAAIYTNTNPGGVYDVGRLAALVPKARFVFVLRNKDDLAFRTYGKHYDSGNSFAYDLSNIAEYVSIYHRFIGLWMERLPDRCIAVRYEDLVRDPASALARMADLCGVPAPSTQAPTLGDDSGCAEPYLRWMQAASA